MSSLCLGLLILMSLEYATLRSENAFSGKLRRDKSTRLEAYNLKL